MHTGITKTSPRVLVIAFAANWTRAWKRPAGILLLVEAEDSTHAGMLVRASWEKSLEADGWVIFGASSRYEQNTYYVEIKNAEAV